MLSRTQLVLDFSRLWEGLGQGLAAPRLRVHPKTHWGEVEENQECSHLQLFPGEQRGCELRFWMGKGLFP